MHEIEEGKGREDAAGMVEQAGEQDDVNEHYQGKQYLRNHALAADNIEKQQVAENDKEKDARDNQAGQFDIKKEIHIGNQRYLAGKRHPAQVEKPCKGNFGWIADEQGMGL